MLRLLQAPEWQAASAAPQAPPAAPATLPATLPVCLLVYLAAEARWVGREALAELFWPDRPATESLHNLRVNLHRLRQLLRGWGHDEALTSERSRLRLRLPTDVAALQPAAAPCDAAALLQRLPTRWLHGLHVPGFDGFWRWASQEQERLRRLWCGAAGPALVAALQQGDAAAARALADAWQQLDAPVAVRTLQALAPELLAGVWPAPPSAQIPTHAPLPAPPLAGRLAERAALQAGRAAATVVLGEAGIGKTTLLLALHPQALRLRGREGLQAVPYGPVVELLHAQPALLAQAGAYRLDLARVLPEIAPDEPLPPLDAHTAKLRLLEGLARVVEHAGSAGAPPVLLVDDLQWCDSSTLEWLVFLAHRGRLRWLASARAHELPAAARQALQALRAAGLLHELPLAGLPADELAAWCRQRWPAQAWPASRLQRLMLRSAGNPFVVAELVAAELLAPDEDDGTDTEPAAALPPRVRELIQRRLERLPAAARAVAEAAAVLSRPASLLLLSAVAELDAGACVTACEAALDAELLVDAAQGIECRHDLIRAATLAGLSSARLQGLHRRAALALAQVQGTAAAPLEVAAHWDQAGQPQTALAWCHRGALQLKDSGRFDEAQTLWQRVVAESLDAALVLRARLALAECALLNDLPAGRQALEAVLDEVGAVAEPGLRAELEAQALAGAVDNAVFAGDLPHARRLAARLRPLLPRLQGAERAHGCEVLIELAMREPDFPAAWALLAQARQAAPRRPSLLSFEGQIHWFSGAVVQACESFEALLERHPEHCGGLTIENDLAVMCWARGDLARAETLARRSLESWKGVVHTETLSLLVLGSTLTSAGRHAAAGQALHGAAERARQQTSTPFLAEAQTREARLRLQCGQFDAALALLDATAPLMGEGDEALRLSQYLDLRAACLAALGRPLEPGLVARLAAVHQRSSHPLVQLRQARVALTLARQQGDTGAALGTAQAMVGIARRAGLQEGLAEALLQHERALEQGAGPAAQRRVLLDEALALAEHGGYADLAWRALLRRARLAGRHGAAFVQRAQPWLERLQGGDGNAAAPAYDAQAAGRREPPCA